MYLFFFPFSGVLLVAPVDIWVVLCVKRSKRGFKICGSFREYIYIYIYWRLNDIHFPTVKFHC